MGSSPLRWFCACKTATLAYELLVFIGPSPHLWFLYEKQRLVEQHKRVYGYQTSPAVLCVQTSVISTRITSFYGCQPSSVVLYMQNSNFRTRLSSLYGSQTSSEVLSTHNSVKHYNGSRPHLWFCKTATLGLEIQVSVGPRSHMWFLHAKQRLLDQNDKSLWSQTWPVVLCLNKSVLSIRITSPYGSQHPSVVFAGKIATFGPELQISVCTRPHLSFCACKSTWLAPEILASTGSSPHLWFFPFKRATLRPNYMCLWVPDLTSDFLHAKQRA